MGEEYTYDIGKYTIGVDTNGEGGIGLTVAIIENDKINFLGNCYGDNARCIDLLIRENQELKKQLEEINNFISKAGFVNIEQLMLDYCAKIEQQKEFIDFLEKTWEETQDIWYIKILNKYREIAGKDINVGDQGDEINEKRNSRL